MHNFSCKWYMAGKHRVMKGAMELVDIMEEKGIKQRLVTGPTLRWKVFLGAQ